MPLSPPVKERLSQWLTTEWTRLKGEGKSDEEAASWLRANARSAREQASGATLTVPSHPPLSEQVSANILSEPKPSVYDPGFKQKPYKKGDPPEIPERYPSMRGPITEAERASAVPPTSMRGPIEFNDRLDASVPYALSEGVQNFMADMLGNPQLPGMEAGWRTPVGEPAPNPQALAANFAMYVGFEGGGAITRKGMQKLLANPRFITMLGKSEGFAKLFAAFMRARPAATAAAKAAEGVDLGLKANLDYMTMREAVKSGANSQALKQAMTGKNWRDMQAILKAAYKAGGAVGGGVGAGAVSLADTGDPEVAFNDALNTTLFITAVEAALATAGAGLGLGKEALGPIARKVSTAVSDAIRTVEQWADQPTEGAAAAKIREQPARVRNMTQATRDAASDFISDRVREAVRSSADERFTVAFRQALNQELSNLGLAEQMGMDLRGVRRMAERQRPGLDEQFVWELEQRLDPTGAANRARQADIEGQFLWNLERGRLPKPDAYDIAERKFREAEARKSTALTPEEEALAARAQKHRIDRGSARASAPGGVRMERREGLQARGRQVFATETNATQAEIDKLYLGQMEEVATLPRDAAKARAEEILAQIRAGAAKKPPSRTIPESEWKGAERRMRERQASEREWTKADRERVRKMVEQEAQHPEGESPAPTPPVPPPPKPPPGGGAAGAIFEPAGIQKGIPGKIPDIEQFRLLRDITDPATGEVLHPKRSIVSRSTLEKAGLLEPKRTPGALSAADRMKAERAAKAAGARPVPTIEPETSTPEETIRRSRPRAIDTMTGDDALGEIRADPLGNRPIDFSIGHDPLPPGAPTDLLTPLKALAGKLGFKLQSVVTEPPGLSEAEKRLFAAGKLKGPKGEGLTTFHVLDGNKPLFSSNSLTDTLAELKKRAEAKTLVVAAEPLAEIALADDPTDDDAERTAKLWARNIIRAGTVATIGATLSGGRWSSRSMWEAAQEKAMSGIGAALDRVSDDGAKIRMFEDWASTKAAIGQFYLGLRNPEELFRHDKILSKPASAIASANRSINARWSEFRDMFTLAHRAGVRRASTPDLNVGAILDGISSALIRKLPTPTTGDTSMVRGAWSKAAEDSFRTDSTLTPARRDAAIKAIHDLDPKHFVWVKKFAGVYRDLRREGEEVFIKDFEIHEGRERPFCVINTVGRDPNGKPLGLGTSYEFVERFRSEAEAKKFITNAAKSARNRMPPDATIEVGGYDMPIASVPDSQISGMVIQKSTQPLQEEIEQRMGKTVSAYLTHLAYKGLDEGLDMKMLSDAFPHMDLNNLVNEIRTLRDMKGGPAAKRKAFEDVFGTLTDEEYADLHKRAKITIGKAGDATDTLILRGIPRRIFVKFYEDRHNAGVYDTSAVRALQTYIPAVLRDIHYTPHLFDVARALETGKVAGDNPLLVREFADWTRHILGREPYLDRDMGRITGKLASFAYNGILWARLGPAYNNLIGQTLLVGVPEMGVDNALAALFTMTDPLVWKTLIGHDIVRQALPLGEKSLAQALKNVRSATSVAELRGGIRDTIGSSLNFMAWSEMGIRTWAFIGGMLESMKADGTLAKHTFNPADPGALMALRKAMKSLDSRPEHEILRHLRGGEDMVRRSAFFFESVNMPRLFRDLKRFPIAQPFLMFTNFPINYANRFITVLRDASDMRLPASVRRTNQGKIIRHLAMTALVAGPMGLPLIHMMTEEVDEKEPGLGGFMRTLFQPYQDFFNRAWAGRDLSRFATTQPITDLVDPQRLPNAPLPRVVKHALWDADLLNFNPALEEEVRVAREKVLGGALAWSPVAKLYGQPAPDNIFLPEVVATMLPAGGAIEDWLRAFTANARSGITEGPLDAQGKLKYRDDSPLLRPIMGRPESEAAERRNMQFVAKREKERTGVRHNFIQAVVNPNSTDATFNSALDGILRYPDVLNSIDPDDYVQAMADYGATPYERQIRRISKSDAEALLYGDPIAGTRGLIDEMRNIKNKPPGEQRRLSQAFLAAVMKANSD